MENVSRKNKTLPLITWVLTGLFLGSVVGSLPFIKVLACAEVSVLEFEFEADDDSTELDLAVLTPNEQRFFAETWHHHLGCVSSQSSRTVRESHLVRGPPRC
jgi:hypothetical protein